MPKFSELANSLDTQLTDVGVKLVKVQKLDTDLKAAIIDYENAVAAAKATKEQINELLGNALGPLDKPKVG